MLRPPVAKGPRGRRIAGTAPRRKASIRPRTSPARDDEVSAVAHAVDVLVALEHGPEDLAGVARATGLPAATVRRLLASLGYGDLVVHDPAAKTFLLGPGCFGILDAVVRGGGGLDVIAGPILARLGASTAETVALYVRAGPRRICAAQVASPQPVRYTARLGMEKPVHAGSMGKVLLAFSDPDERSEILDHLELIEFTDVKVSDRDAIERELQIVRRRGYALSRDERSAGATSISAPVFDNGGRALAALSILGPTERLPDAVLAKLRPSLLVAAREISSRLATVAARKR